jgi:hypothetical protein
MKSSWTPLLTIALGGNSMMQHPTGQKTIPELEALFRQSVFERPTGDKDVNDVAHLTRDPNKRQIVDGGMS